MTRKELEQVWYLSHELKLREKQLKDLIEASQVKSPMPSGMPFANTNEISDIVAETAMKIVVYSTEVETYKEALQIRKQNIDRWVMNLKDGYLRQIVHYRCYELLSWEKIGLLMGTTADSVRMYYNRKIPK